MENEVIDLTGIYGFRRLYKTLIQDGGNKKTISDTLYHCYLANRSALIKSGYLLDDPIEKEMFFYMMENNLQRPYRTDIQTIKALTLLEWNMDESQEFSSVLQKICEIKSDYTHRFYNENGYSYSDPVTSFSLCEETLDPEHEPEQELNPAAFLRMHNKGPKFVFISAPLRGDVENNIAFAKDKARQVFEQGNIPVCPHLMFPPIAEVSDAKEDLQARMMCLALLERCDEMNVYGPEWTEGMWAEIHHAESKNIPIYTDQTQVPRTAHKKGPCR